MKQILILEGINDINIISSLLEAKKLKVKGYEEKVKFNDEFLKKGGSKKEAINALNIALKGRQYDKIAIIVDADSQTENPAEDTWRSIAGILTKNNYTNLPKQMIPEGIIIEQENKPKIGIWIMPDNQSEGYIEHFYEGMIDPNDVFLQKATETVNDFVKEKMNRFSVVHLQKSKIRTWLAWQENVELPMHTSLLKYSKDGYIQLDNAHTTRFMDWFSRIFDLESPPLSITH